MERWDNALELPPRTRRIRAVGDALTEAHGTTSAHAENTVAYFPIGPNHRNYLRARGEYLSV